MAQGLTTAQRSRSMTGGDSLADILERILDTGIVIAGDIRVQLADIELLTIQIRLIVCSVDKAQELGMDWWKTAPFLSSNTPEHTGDLEPNSTQLQALDDRLERLERSIALLAESRDES